MSVRKLEVGDKVVFAKDKVSPTPGPRAQEVSPQAKGDGYSYIVEKYWIVKSVHDDDTVTLVTRRAKEHVVSLDDPRLRRASFWEKLFSGRRFPKLEALDQGSAPADAAKSDS